MEMSQGTVDRREIAQEAKKPCNYKALRERMLQ
jgi:hypothetical protein